MSAFNAINLDGLPAPGVVESLDYEVILSQMLAEYQAANPEHTALVESDPAYKVLEVAAYREMGLRQRVNDAARAVMVAYATGADLDNLAALVPLSRKMIDPGDAEAVPPVPPTYENDAAFRRRVQLAPEGFSVAGPTGAYVFHALAVAGVKDAGVNSPAPCDVTVYVLAAEGDGTPSASLLDAVRAKLGGDDVRPLTDRVTVRAAEIVNYAVNATLHLMPGPSGESVEQAARAALERYTSERHALGLGVAVSGIYEALHKAGVRRVELVSPAGDIPADESQAAYCTGITLSTVVG